MSIHQPLLEATKHIDLPRLEELYRHLHANPELSGQEFVTARLMADRLTALGYTTHAEIGGTGVVGILDRGPGPVVMLRADMDALPVKEETDLPYASTAIADHGDVQVSVMHACGHDMHMAAMIGAAEELAASPDWRGRLLVLFQPAEETGRGARAMIADGLYERVPTPDVVLGQHLMPIPAGYLGVPLGPAFAAGRNLRIVLNGRGGHGSQPERAINPVGLASMVAVRIQSLKATAVGAFDPAVITIGQISSGNAPNIIPDTAELLLTIRAYSDATMALLTEKVKAIVAAEAAIAGNTCTYDIESLHEFPVLVNDSKAARNMQDVFHELAEVRCVTPEALMISEDIGELATAAGAPLVYWWLGGSDPTPFAGRDDTTIKEFLDYYPPNHSSHFAPVIQPTLGIGVAALAKAATHWLGQSFRRGTERSV